MFSGFIEVQHFSAITELWSGKTWAILTHGISISFWGTVIFSLLGAWALYRNVRKVQKEGSDGVAFEWEIMFFGMYLSLWFYGMEEQSLALIVQWFFRVPLYMWFIWVIYKDRRRTTSIERLVGSLVIVTTCLSPIFPRTVASVLLWIGVVFVATQPIKMLRTGKLNGVGFEKLVVYFGSSLFWLLYGVALTSPSIMGWASAYSAVYLWGILTYQYYLRQQR